MVVLKMKIKPCEMILSSGFVGSRTELPPPLVPVRVLSRLSFRCVCIHFQAGIGLQVFSSGLVQGITPYLLQVLPSWEREKPRNCWGIRREML